MNFEEDIKESLNILRKGGIITLSDRYHLGPWL